MKREVCQAVYLHLFNRIIQLALFRGTIANERNYKSGLPGIHIVVVCVHVFPDEAWSKLRVLFLFIVVAAAVSCFMTAKQTLQCQVFSWEWYQFFF